ncbi:ATPase RavA stimulator ViaA [Alginatibacterium sediminis]|uniref:ATPase RavA stimulator ViaA n=1 Tax=Alginatibacterium sediminis TaxID=2164068 RepID=A0A420ENF1_9ALTE|nr:ATPase RavA stimulator ViaA [Alginatibacterium sediminis]RKF22232.1 ATPase RavA stimulator ViaA [Alginatibacterium sediminis]
MIDSLQLGAMLIESGVIDEVVREMMVRPQLIAAAESSSNIKRSMKSQLSRWRSQVMEQVSEIPNEQRFADEIVQYQRAIEMSADQFVEQVDIITLGLEGSSSYYIEAKKLCDDPNHRKSPMFQNYFCNQWFDSILNDLKQAQIAEVENEKEQLLTDLYQRIDTMQDLEGISETGDQNHLGRLWDMAAAKLSRRDVNHLHFYTQFLKDQPLLLEIAESLGRMALDQAPSEIKEPEHEELQMVEEQSDMAIDDIVGIHESDDLSKLLPSETMFLAYPELEVVFYKHLADKQLLNYRSQGKSRTLKRVKTVTVKASHELIHPGPFILAIDASGSMQGFPEKCAKAFAYGLMQIALAQERDCRVLIFSSELIEYQLTRQDGLKEALSFLNYSFLGGTDFNAVFENAISTLSTQQFENADLVVLSDFIAPTPPAKLQTLIEALKTKSNRFHGLNLSRYGNPALMDVFDHIWQYHPSIMERAKTKSKLGKNKLHRLFNERQRKF